MKKVHEKQQNIERILDIILVVSMLFFLILFVPFAKGYFTEDPSDISEIVELCSNMSLRDSSKCAIDNTSGFYKYNFDNVGRELSFSELVEEGGVCTNWNDYYTELGENLGYNTESVTIKVSDGLSHEFGVWTDQEGYCVMDQTEFYCFEFGSLD